MAADHSSRAVKDTGLGCMDTRIMGSNPTESMNTYPRLSVLRWHCIDLIPIQGVLPNVDAIHNFRKNSELGHNVCSINLMMMIQYNSTTLLLFLTSVYISFKFWLHYG
jgi:hypothetical protein